MSPHDENSRAAFTQRLTEQASWHADSLLRIINLLGDLSRQQQAAPQHPAEGAAAQAGGIEKNFWQQDTAWSARLTQREGEVLGLLVEGHPNKHIARILQISEPTVKHHLHAVFLKLGVTDRAQAISMVLGGLPVRRSGPPDASQQVAARRSQRAYTPPGEPRERSRAGRRTRRPPDPLQDNGRDRSEH